MQENKHGNGVCPTCGRKRKRSSEANRRYWALLNLIAERIKPNGQAYSPEAWHCYFKGRFLGMQEIMLPSGQTITVPNSTADLDVSEFNDFMAQTEAWAAENGVWLEE